MNDAGKIKEQLIHELAQARQRIVELEAAEAGYKHAEEVLQESEAEYRELIESIEEAVYALDGNKTEKIAHFGSWDWDIVSNELSCSDEMCRIWGMKSQECRSYEGLGQFCHPDDAARNAQAIGEALRGKKPYNITHVTVVAPLKCEGKRWTDHASPISPSAVAAQR